MTTAALTTWRDGPVKQAIIDFVATVTGADGSEPVPPEERVAVFDNDGTLWCEQPMPIQLDFILHRFAEMLGADPSLAERQPWKATAERDHAWFGSLMTDHYAGDDTNVKILAGGILAAYAGITVDDFEQQADTFLRTAQHPTLGRPYVECAYRPMVDLLEYLASNGFTNYIASGGGRDFMRPISVDMYGIPRERVIGSSSTFAYASNDRGGTITHNPEADYLDDGPEKPVRIWNRTGRRPLLAAGNSNGDVPMLEFTFHPDRPTLRLLVRHDDAEREFDYTAGAEHALERAAADGWTVISVKDDWTTVF
jgi:phosphoserine phosphatase